MSLMCDHEAFTKPSVAFVGQINECAYFFEVRTAAACATINQAQALGPAAVFGAMYVFWARGVTSNLVNPLVGKREHMCERVKALTYS
jgi:hypothetical protein